jgi:hypothetical protein
MKATKLWVALVTLAIALALVACAPERTTDETPSRFSETLTTAWRNREPVQPKGSHRRERARVVPHDSLARPGLQREVRRRFLFQVFFVLIPRKKRVKLQRRPSS